MRTVRKMRGLLGLAASVVLVAVLGVGCGGDQATGPELPESPEPVETIVIDGILPGDRRAPDAPTVTAQTPRPPIGRTKSPVPVRTPPTLTGIPGS